MSIQIATWNVNSLKVRLPQVLEWLEKTQTDILCLQELKQTSDLFEEEAFKAIGYHCAWIGQKTYNGVAIVSKYPLENITYNNPYFEDEQKRLIKAQVLIKEQTFQIVCVYCPNGGDLDSEKYPYKLAWFDALTHYIKNLQKEKHPIILLGDFNIAPSDLDHHPKFKGPILISPPEREAFQRLLDLPLIDCYRIKHPEKREYSWWDYRMSGFKRNAGLRIDHILITPELLNRVHQVRIDTEPRRLERPSDHTPVILELI